MILGLDISTSIVGATVLTESGEVIYCESWDLRNKNKFPSLFAKAQRVKQMLAILHDVKKIHFDKVYVEQSLQAFRPGFSSAKTLLTLAKFNGIVSYILERDFHSTPEYIGASTARKACGIKVQKGQKAKQTVLNFLLDNEESFNVEYTKHGNPVPGSYDRADSYIIAKAGLTNLNS